MRYILSLILLMSTSPSFALKKYVKAHGRSTGISWQLAMGDLQKAIDQVSLAGGGEVWVAAGSYYPTNSKNRKVSFHLKPGVNIYGGFAGFESKLEQRDIKKNRTILDGNIGAKDTDKDNSYHVLTASSRSEINGFIIRNGNANLSDPSYEIKPGKLPDAMLSIKMSPYSKGGGIYAAQKFPKIINCHFENNKAFLGGAIYSSGLKQASARNGHYLNSSIIEGNSFYRNKAYLSGGAIANDLFSPSHIANNSFAENEAKLSGGAITNLNNSSSFIANNLFKANKAKKGGAVAVYHSSSPVILDSSFIENTAKDKGSAIYQASTVNAVTVIRSSSFLRNNSENQGYPLYSWLRDNMSVSFSCLDVKTENKTNQFSKECLSSGYKNKAHNYEKRLSRWSEPRKKKSKKSFVKKGRNKKIYVDANTKIPAPYRDGLSWRTAYKSLEKAIKDNPQKQRSFLLRSGVYKPTSKNRDFSFTLSPGSELIGGFSKSKSKYKKRTIISGDIGRVNTKEDNLHHVIRLTTDNQIKNLTIASGYADDDIKGGAAILASSEENSKYLSKNNRIEKVLFILNSAKKGGAIYFEESLNNEIRSSEFKNNIADHGGALYLQKNSRLKIERTTFRSNKSQYQGAAIFIDGSSKVKSGSSRYLANKSSSKGAVVYLDNEEILKGYSKFKSKKDELRH